MRKPRLVSAVLVLILLVGCSHGFKYSDGDRAGYVLKFSKRGILCPTWEGSMNLAGTGQNSLVEFDFTVDGDKDAVVRFMQEAVTSGRRIKVNYVDTWLSGPCTSSSSYFIQSASYTE